ncbi:hypothetical protein [Flavobacterium facile]|uniref:hypothetical protein n=1 Tax=Flavobacterium facile TaxID=2893174 RepID=UPI002E7A67C4|nr:hypothetical protein [Flavobacterium sp. T-12]
MKKVILVFILFAFVACKSVKENANEVMLTSKNEVVTNDYTIVINKIVSDSRCPEGTNCIWAGEIVMELSVLQNKEIKESLELTFSQKTKEENLAWFRKYIPNNKKLIKYKISPSKTEKQLELKDYKIELILE